MALGLPTITRGVELFLNPADSVSQGPWESSGPSTRSTPTMAWFRRILQLPAQESHVSVVLVFCVIAMSVMSVALVWQAQIIANQREAIRWLMQMKFGG